MKNLCEICKKEIKTDTHHIQSTSLEGSNKLYNKCNICPNCHRLIHTGEIIIEGRFFTTDCKVNQSELIWRYKDTDSITGFKNPEVFLY